PAAIGALIIEIFDDRDVAIDIAGDGNVGVMQYQGFRQDVFVDAFGPRPAGRKPEHGRAGTDEAERLAPAADRARLRGILDFGHGGSFSGRERSYSLRTR